MYDVPGGGVVELAPPEAMEVRGGMISPSELAVAAYLTKCFKAGFDFGFNTLGPMLLD